MARTLSSTFRRKITPVIETRMHDEPVIILEGPRSVGKSTVLREIAKSSGAAILDLDDLATREAVARDPANFISGASPILIDEYQKVPKILDAIKAELNQETRPGRFVLTGSIRNESLPQNTQTLTGRVHRMVISPLTQGEIDGTNSNFIEKLFDESHPLITSSISRTSREQYFERISKGGFPLALTRGTSPQRSRWFSDYVFKTLDQDIREISRIRQSEMLSKLLIRLASQTGQVLNISRAAQDIGLEKSTAENYVKLLESVFLIQRLPAWGTTLRARSAASPKLHVCDSGLLSYLLRLTPTKLSSKSPAALTEFGHLLESFIFGEISRQSEMMDDRLNIGHWRTRDDDEVDIVVERESGEVVAVEVKAGQRVTSSDFQALRKLRDASGSAFVAGAIIYLGNRSYSFEDRLYVISADRIWL
jgi:predicted AAA+ superfamily ATPase